MESEASPEQTSYTYELDGKIISPKLMKADCNEEMKLFAYETAFEALEKYSVEKDLSEHIKNRFDEVYTKTWHCIVGNDYSVSLTHDSRFFIFFSIEKTYFLLFKL